MGMGPPPQFEHNVRSVYLILAMRVLVTGGGGFVGVRWVYLSAGGGGGLGSRCCLIQHST